MDKIEIAKKMTNWSSAEMKIRVKDVDNSINALQEAEGVVNVKQIIDKEANLWVSFKPSMLEKSINNIIMEKCNFEVQIIESKLKQ